jgi:CubicO group peptidase (beta-lactamase class C family)
MLVAARKEECLPRSTPELQGVRAEGISRFISSARSNYELHSFMLVRHGYVIAEGWSAPYRPDAVQLLNSLSKSFTSTAVGFAVAEAQLAVSDRVLEFFPQQLPEHISPNLRELTVEHLLMMSVGQTGYPTDIVIRERDWVSAFLRVPIEHTPGRVFSYNNMATYMLSAIVQKVSGQKLIDYLESRLFAPLGIRDKHWESCPVGINVGGWGLSLKSEALAKFGQLYLQRGEWKGTQLLPQRWVDAASSLIQQTSDWDVVALEGESQAQAIARLKANSDFHQGYGYQFWRSRLDAYRGDGAFGQFCIVIPPKDAVVVITSHAWDMQGLLNMVWEHLLPAMHDGTLPADPSSTELQRELMSMAVPAPQSQIRSSAPFQRRFRLENNTWGAERASFDLRSDSCVFTLEFADGVAQLHCGMGQWADNVINIPGAPPKFITQGERRALKVAAAAFWTDAHTLKMQWRYYETPNYDVVTCRFERSTVTIEFVSDIVQLSKGSLSDDRPTLRGQRCL